MASYTYTKLNTAVEDIRLLRLMPGNFDADICFSIVHVPLAPPKNEVLPKRLSIKRLQKTLPKGWFVKETFEGRYLFMQMGPFDLPNSWEHPDSSVDRTLYHLDLDKLPEYEPTYEALSYVWGSMEETVTAFVVGFPGSGDPSSPMQISPSLASALRQLRYTNRTRTLWVDAICINQDDIDERNAQVKRMGRIYSLATRVVVWLGEESADSRLALTTIQYFGQQVEQTIDSSLGDAPGAKEPRWWWAGYRLPYDQRTWSSLLHLFHRVWFSRVWVLQEVSLANQRTIVQCGADTCYWSGIRKFITFLSSKLGVPAELSILLSSYGSGMRARYNTDLAHLLSWARNRQCIDPRDKVYGILSLAPLSFSSRIKPQYWLSTSQIYLDAFLAHLNAAKRLDLLAHCRIERRIEGGLGASWVPNWAVEAGSFLRDYRLSSRRQASGHSAAHAKYVCPSALEVVGVQCTRIGSVASVASGSVNEQIQQTYRHIVSQHGENYVTGGSLMEACFEAVLHGQTVERFIDTENVAPGTMEVLAEKSASPSVISGEFDPNAISHLVTPDFDKVSIITTREGYLGIGAAGAQTDDLICVLLGCDKLIMLRPTVPGSDPFLVVGPCSMEGLKDGEGLLGPILEPWKLQVKPLGGNYIPHFFNTSTKVVSMEDPRLPPLPADWEEQAQRDRTQDDPFFLREFQNKVTGEIMNSDPRMLPDALRQRGVRLETFRLV